MKTDNMYIYDFRDRSDIISENVNECLKVLYNNTYPKCDYESEILPKCKEIKEKAEKEGKDLHNAFIYKDEKTNKQYIYPLDFYYSPIDFQYMIIDNFIYAYGIERSWESDIETLKDYLNNIDDRTCIEVYEKDENGISQRSYKHLPDLKTVLSEIITDETQLNAAYDKIFEYINNCQKFYKFGLIEENQFRDGVVFHSPNTNPETVKEAWKIFFNKDIEIPSDDNWTDCYDERLIDED